MATGNVKAARKARHKALKGRPLLDKDGAPLSCTTSHIKEIANEAAFTEQAPEMTDAELLAALGS